MRINDRSIQLKKRLIEEIQSDYFPGARFLSNRQIARLLGVSYVTAHKLLDSLCMEGYLERHSTGGTFLPGQSLKFQSAHLILNPAAKKGGRFGEAFLNELTKRLDRAAIPWKLSWTNQRINSSSQDYVILWERGRNRIARQLNALGHQGLLVNQYPHTSVTQHFDSVVTDFFVAGVLAGKFLRSQKRCKKTAVIAMPSGKIRAAETFIRGFRAIWPGAQIFNSWHWGRPVKQDILEKLSVQNNLGICCCVEARMRQILSYCEELDIHHPVMLVFAPPPKPPELKIPFLSANLTELVNAVVRIVSNRFAGDQSPPVHITLEPKLVV